MKKLLFLLPLALSGCATQFILGTSYPAQGQTREQTIADIESCKVIAYQVANTPTEFAKTYLRSLTLIGVPGALQNEKDNQRRVFSKCMTERGYRVVQ